MLEDNVVLQYQLYKLDISCSSLAIDPHTVREIDAHMAADGHLRLLQILEIIKNSKQLFLAYNVKIVVLNVKLPIF